jgi:Rieske Fe-S protein
MKSELSSSRRQFVKMLTYGSVASMVGRPWRGTVLAQIAPSNVGSLYLKLSDYPPLLADFGSVRLGLAPLDENSNPIGAVYPILINRDTGDRFYALDSTCRHAGCMVFPYDTGFEAIVCPCHGSSYALDGSVLTGPTVSPLISYPIHFDGVETLRIDVPSLGYRVTGALVESGEMKRFRLSFPTLILSEYEVRFREKADGEWSVIPFALDVDGLADQFSLFGDEQTAVVYVDRTTPTGFYAVTIKLVDLTAV